MPKKSGIEVLYHLKDRNLIDLIPVVVVTGQGTDDTDYAAYDLGAADIIYKPFSRRTISKRVENLIDLYETRLYNRNDQITGLPEMRELVDIVNREIELIERYNAQEQYCVVYLDIYKFTAYNIKYGVNAGDEALRFVAEQIKREFPVALVARAATDHFVIFADEEGC